MPTYILINLKKIQKIPCSDVYMDVVDIFCKPLAIFSNP